MTEKLRPLGDRIVLRREKAPEKVGLIVIPDAAKEKPLRCIVVEVGTGALRDGRRVEPSVNKDDSVLVGKYAGSEMMIDDVECLVVREDDIVGVIETV